MLFKFKVFKLLIHSSAISLNVQFSTHNIQSAFFIQNWSLVISKKMYNVQFSMYNVQSAFSIQNWSLVISKKMYNVQCSISVFHSKLVIDH